MPTAAWADSHSDIVPPFLHQRRSAMLLLGTGSARTLHGMTSYRVPQGCPTMERLGTTRVQSTHATCAVLGTRVRRTVQEVLDDLCYLYCYNGLLEGYVSGHSASLVTPVVGHMWSAFRILTVFPSGWIVTHGSVATEAARLSREEAAAQPCCLSRNMSMGDNPA